MRDRAYVPRRPRHGWKSAWILTIVLLWGNKWYDVNFRTMLRDKMSPLAWKFAYKYIRGINSVSGACLTLADYNRSQGDCHPALRELVIFSLKRAPSLDILVPLKAKIRDLRHEKAFAYSWIPKCYKTPSEPPRNVSGAILALNGGRDCYIWRVCEGSAGYS